jgi:hypothetical protein
MPFDAPPGPGPEPPRQPLAPWGLFAVLALPLVAFAVYFGWV